MNSVLIVDDNAENRYYLETLLSASGWKVESARNGQEALKLALSMPPDALVSDLLMPVMDGYTLLRRMRAEKRLCDVPFLVYTATYTSREDERLALDLGADAFLVKPAEPDVIVNCLGEICARRSSGRAAEPVREGEPDLLELYNRTLIRKLEGKMEQLDAANRHLEEDLAARKAIEASLRESDERFRLLTRATREAIWDWDVARDTLWWNEGMQRLFGHADEVVADGRAWWIERIHPDDCERVSHGREEAVVTGAEHWSAQYRFRRRDGSYANVEDRGHVLRDDAGTAVRMVGAMWDATERLALEAQLRQAQRLEAIGQLTGGVAHDFNNLLTVIMGNAELLAETHPPGTSEHEFLMMISASAQRGADLTRRLLTFARKQALEARVVDVNQQIGQIDALLRHTLGSDIRMDFQLAADLWPALVDPAQLENALLNLCLNARDAMPQGGWLTVETSKASVDEASADPERALAAGDYVQLAVSDTGTGIPPEHLARVFEPFFTTKDEGKGSGLGLAMVYGFIRQSGGHINIYSELGRGTTVKLYLPRGSDAAAVETAAPVMALPRGAEHILLVEDDDLVRDYTSYVLQQLGYTIHPAVDGKAALEMLAGEVPIDLLFTDIVMPGMNGFAVAEEAVKLRPGLKVLYTSGYTRQAAARQEPDMALSQMLSKPYARGDLARRIREVLDSR